jgi:F-type H+-transporting ATPase subunit epsilon
LKLKVFLPTEIFMDIDVVKVVGESPSGSFAVLPRHVDIASALVPGIFAYFPSGSREMLMAVNGGILIKQGENLSLATRMAVKGELGSLKSTVEKFVSEVDEKERKARTAVAKMEADLVRRFVEFGKNA